LKKQQKSSMQNDVVFANAALAIAMMKKTTIDESIEMAKDSLMSGKALQRLKTLQNISN
jgi:anthranilate phosphoribosyltransferase